MNDRTICTATLTADRTVAGPLADLGGTAAGWLMFGLALVITGTVALAIHRRRLLAVTVVALTLGAGLTLHSPAPAAAAVDYAGDCALIDVSDLRVDSGQLQDLLPGDAVTLVGATVSNPSNLPLRLSAEVAVEPGTSPLGGLPGALVLGATTSDGSLHGLVTDPVVLGPGEDVPVALTVHLDGIDDHFQGLSADARLTLTAMQEDR